jgi:uncharacterized phage protein (TIGR01671 family)
MRELKFRVWDNLKKEWLKKKVYHSSISLNEGGIGEFVFKQHPEGYIIQQYTSMKDRNGVEVYEGDIVAEKITEEMAANGDSAKVGVVYFAAGTFLIDGDGALYEHVFSVSPHILEDFIVIGNRFENPELLK